MPSSILKRYNQKYLLTAEHNLVHNLFASKTIMPANSGIIEVQSRYDRLGTFETPLDDTQSNPPPQNLHRTDIQTRLRTYSTYLIITDEVVYSNVDRALNQGTARLGQASYETRDILQRGMLESGGSVINCTEGINGDLPTEMTREDISEVVGFLQNTSAEFITSHIDGANKFGTGPVGQAYGVSLSARMIPILNNIDGFIRQFAYPSPSQKITLSSEWGASENARFFTSAQGSISSKASLLGNDIANCFFQGLECHKYTVQEGMWSQIIHHKPGTGNDPAELRHTLAAKMRQGEAISNDLWMINLRSSGIGIAA